MFLDKNCICFCLNNAVAVKRLGLSENISHNFLFRLNVVSCSS